MSYSTKWPHVASSIFTLLPFFFFFNKRFTYYIFPSSCCLNVHEKYSAIDTLCHDKVSIDPLFRKKEHIILKSIRVACMKEITHHPSSFSCLEGIPWIWHGEVSTPLLSSLLFWNMCSFSSRNTQTLAASESSFESLMSRSLMKVSLLAPLRHLPIHQTFWLIYPQLLEWQLMIVPEFFRVFLSAMLESS